MLTKLIGKDKFRLLEARLDISSSAMLLNILMKSMAVFDFIICISCLKHFLLQPKLAEIL